MYRNFWWRWFVFFLLIVSSSVSRSYAEDADLKKPHAFPLHYTPQGFSLVAHIGLEDKEVVFRKEPDFGGREIVRGSLAIGPHEKDFLGFAWDRAQAKLYLDLNYNLDLTDDPSGVFKSGRDGFFQVFEDIRVESMRREVPVHYSVNMQLYQHRKAGGSCEVTVKSGWKGEIELHGKKWLMGVADNLNGTIGAGDKLVLQQLDEDGQRALSTSQADLFSVSDKLFLDGHGYDLEFDFEADGTSSLLCAKFNTSQPAMGELRLEGCFIKRLVLEEPGIVILDRPGSNVMIPAGNYNSGRVYLAGEDSADIFSADMGRLFIAEGKPAILKVGGPLNNTVAVKRTGSSLRLDYALTGVGGRQYAQLERDNSKRPQFTIRRDGKEVASGSFEYG